jgi:cation diffusion facilitator CzcD-associated flavoprotein CzcO
VTAPRIAIIGAGWSGLQIATVLRECGHDVRVFEQLDDVGGTWHPANAYEGLSIHTPSFRCQFHDFDGWRDRDRLARLPASDVFDNCRAFADARRLRPLIAFRHRVLAIRYEPVAGVNHVTVRDDATGEARTETFDYVVSTQFNAPRMPAFKGQESFAGEIIHSSALKAAVLERIGRERPRIVLVGGSKAAADVALLFVQRGVRFTWLLRRMYWFLSYDRGYWDAAHGRPSRRFHRLLYFAGLGLARGPLSTRLIFRAWRLSGLMQCPGRESPDVTAFHHGWLDDGQIRTLRTRTEQVYGDVDRLDGRTLHTTDGRTIDADLLVCATGCDPVASPIALTAGDAPVRYGDVELVYRASVIPEMPRLVFTGYSMFGFGPLNGYHRAAWILRFIEQDLGTEQLRAQARADGDTPFLFRRGSFLFDGSTNLLTTVKAMNRRMGEGLYDYADLKRHYHDIAVRHVYAPLRGVERFLSARRRPGA